jgi:hypothetical protein
MYILKGLQKMKTLLKDLLGFGPKKEKEGRDKFHLPIESVGDLIKGRNDTYKIVLKVSPVNGELLSGDGLELASEAIQGALASFEGRFGIYIQSEGVNIETNLSNLERLKLELNSEIKLVLLEEQKKHIQSMAAKARNVLNFYTVFEVNDSSPTSASELLDDVYQAFKAELESQGMYVDRLSRIEVMALLYRRMNPESSQTEPARVDWDIENILPENGKIFRDGRHIEIENRVYRFYSLIKYPATVQYYRWLKKVFNTKGDINIAITLTPKNKATITRELSKAVNEIGAKELEAKKDEALRQKYRSQKESARAMLAELGNYNVSLYDTNITIGISAPDIKSLNTLSNLLRSKISSTYCQATELKYKGYDPFITTLPVLPRNSITDNYVWNLTTREVASLIPYDSSVFFN